MACPRCNVQLLPQERSSAVSGTGLFAALIAFIGIVVLFANALVGIGIIIAALLLGSVTRRKRLVLICPSCKSVTPVA
jgi:hypothetical protein